MITSRTIRAGLQSGNKVARAIRPVASRNVSKIGPLDDRPFRILGLQQVAVGSLTKAPMLDIWTDVLGLEKVGHYHNIRENVDEDILRLGSKGSPFAVEVDLMSPVDPDKSPKVRLPSLWTLIQ